LPTLAFLGLINYSCQTSSHSTFTNSMSGERIISDSKANKEITTNATALKDTTGKKKVSDCKGTCTGTCSTMCASMCSYNCASGCATCFATCTGTCTNSCSSCVGSCSGSK